MRTLDDITENKLVNMITFGLDGCRFMADRYLLVQASWALEWDHVSVSLKHRCPTWDEMDLVRRICFNPDETVMQLHVPEGKNVNVHPFCLHLWRPQQKQIPRPPYWMVGPRPFDGPTMHLCRTSGPSNTAELRETGPINE